MAEDTAPPTNPGLDLNAIAAVTYSAVFSDVCDAMGLRNQTVSPGIMPLGGAGTLVGWARTALSVPVNKPPTRHYGGEIDFIDSLRPGDVPVVDCSGRPAAAWGELFSTASKGRGARGAVIDGLIRDRRRSKSSGFRSTLVAIGRPTASGGSLSSRPTKL